MKTQFLALLIFLLVTAASAQNNSFVFDELLAHPDNFGLLDSTVQSIIFKTENLAVVEEIDTTYDERYLFLTIDNQVFELPIGQETRHEYVDEFTYLPQNKWLVYTHHYSYRAYDVKSLVIINIVAKSYGIIELESHSYGYYENPENSNEIFSVGSRDSTFYEIRDGEILLRGFTTEVTSKYFQDRDEEMEVERTEAEHEQNGLYSVQNNALVRIKRFQSTGKLVPVYTMHNMQIGSPIEEFVHGNYIQMAPAWFYGLDGEAEGYQLLSEENDTLICVFLHPINQNNIAHMYAVSPQFVFDEKWHVGVLLKHVLKEYPKATVKIDLISGWEYVYLDDLGLRLIFKTTDKNRVASYNFKQNAEGAFMKAKRKKAKVDLIHVF